MNYKSVFRSQSLRVKILKLLNWIPDSLMLRIQYRIKMGYWPSFKHPKRFTEKLQLYKMRYRNPKMSQCVDKYDVREYVEGKGLGHILNDNPQLRDFDSKEGAFIKYNGETLIVLKK